MKKILLILGVVASSILVTNAQTAKTEAGTSTTKPTKTPEARAKEMVEKLNTAVALKGDQFTKANTLFLDFQKKKAALDESKADFKDKLKALKEERDNQLKAMLTPAQWKLWEEKAKSDGK